MGKKQQFSWDILQPNGASGQDEVFSLGVTQYLIDLLGCTSLICNCQTIRLVSLDCVPWWALVYSQG